MENKGRQKIIAINALSAKTGGGRTYLKGLLPELAKIGKDNIFYIFISKELYNNMFENELFPSNFNFLKLDFSNSFLRAIYEQIYLPFFVLSHKIDVLFCPANIVSFFAPAKKVVWVQNIIPFMNKGIRSSIVSSWLMFWVSKLSVKIADRVIASTENSLELLLAAGTTPSKCRRIYLGASSFIFENQKKEKLILSVSNIYPHKNFDVLIRAFALLPDLIKNEYQIIIAGKVVGKESQEEFIRLKKTCGILSINDKIVFDMTADEFKIKRYYEKSELFVMPSLVESFSLPVVEAMSAGLPIIASDSTCLSEVAGNAGLFFKTNSPKDLAAKIEILLVDNKLSSSLSCAGLKRAPQFSWNKAAKSLLACFAEL
ncbi:MAG: group 1 glycosyl transferase [Candidatus Saganbacteria bacterium]|uniref:Group 1 glycosyl transferase n=1 Tax=Candidatus Saganbacteria bacterium TaxID=2575572 RepID=A0A833L2H8_UNCSA|nr:MAG: group 1 glycosyl transferase [Candidatus Saganbacteria bacterium]